MLSFILIQVESYAVSFPAITSASNLPYSPYSLSNYASSYTANVVNRAITAPISPSSLEASAPGVYPDARYYNQFLAEQARIASYGFAPQVKLAPTVPTSPPASAAVAAPAGTAYAIQTDPVSTSLAPTATVPTSVSVPVISAADAPSAGTPVAAASLPESAAAAQLSTSNNAAVLRPQFAVGPSASYAYEFSRASSLPGTSYNLPYPLYAGSN